MEHKSWFWMLLVFAGTLPIGNGLHYFIGGEAYRSTDSRSYAVIGQIVFGIAVVCYGVWYKKHMAKKTNEVSHRFKVQKSDIDEQKHVNNIAFVR